jgi:hypothetical protein
MALAPFAAGHSQRALPPEHASVFRPTVRADAIVNREPGAQIAVGVAVASAYNVRLSLDAGAGGFHRPEGWSPTGRLDVIARVLSDPFRKSRWALSAGGGIGHLIERGARPRTVAIVTVGVDGPSDGAWVPGVECGLGGGFRIGVTFRRAPLGQR